MVPITIKVVKVKGPGSNWAQKVTWDGVSRYRGFYYKKDAVNNLVEWVNRDTLFWGRNFTHNFHSAEELGIREI